jgi:large conductance mechanosensitive channel
VLEKDVLISYGRFLNALINFLIQAVAIFMVIKVINRLRRQPPPSVPAPIEPTREEKLLMEIRDAIKARSAQ